MQDNIEAVLGVMQFIYGHVMYAELSTKSDFCQGSAVMVRFRLSEEGTDKLVWECPHLRQP